MAEESNGTHNPENIGVPDTWRVVELGTLGLRIHGGGTPSTRNPAYWGGTIPWTTSAYIDDRLYLDRCAGFTTPEGLSNSSSQLVPKGNVLVGTRVGVGKVAINAIDTAISQDLTAIIVDSEQTCSEFLAYSIKSDAIQEAILSASRGTTIKGIPRADLIRIPIPLPPLPEQRRIAAVLNAIQDAIAAQEDVIAAARQFKRSLMQRLFTFGPGREPAETKETEIGEIPAHWEVTDVAEVVHETQYGLNERADHAGTYPVLRMNNLVEGKVSTSDLKYVDLDDSGLTRYRLNVGDVLFNRTNSFELVGKTSLFDHSGIFTFASYLVRLVANRTKTLPEYLNSVLNYEATQARMKYLATRGVSQSNISPTKLKTLAIPLPSISEQQEIVFDLQTIDAKIAAEEDRKTALDALFKSMLHQLMTGQLRLLSDEGLPLT